GEKERFLHMDFIMRAGEDPHFRPLPTQHESIIFIPIQADLGMQMKAQGNLTALALPGNLAARLRDPIPPLDQPAIAVQRDFTKMQKPVSRQIAVMRGAEHLPLVIVEPLAIDPPRPRHKSRTEDLP